MVDNVLQWSGAHEHGVDTVLDVGCGIGGSTRHIARKYGAVGTGITLSPVQVGIAQERSRAAGLSNVSFQVADALNMPFQDDSFGLVWSLESGEVRESTGGRAPVPLGCCCASLPEDAERAPCARLVLRARVAAHAGQTQVHERNGARRQAGRARHPGDVVCACAG
jgi:SAM-dependent methyltransferase